MQKQAEKLQSIAQVQRAVEAACTSVITYLTNTASPTSERAHEIIDQILTTHKCESPEGHIVAAGVQAVEPHEHGHGIIPAGVPIVIDIFPRSIETGYYADMTRTVCIGDPSPELQEMYDVVLKAQNISTEMLAPGVACADIHNAVADYFMEQGYETGGTGSLFTYSYGLVHALGHGVSTEIHDKPHIGPNSTETLQIGDIITLEPGLYYSDIGGIRIEDMFLITEDGYERITDFSNEFVI